MSNYSSSPLNNPKDSSPLHPPKEPNKSETSSTQGKFLKFFSLCCGQETDSGRNIKKQRSQTMKNVEEEVPKQQSQVRKYSETEQMVQSLPAEGKYELRWHKNTPIPVNLTRKECKRPSTIQLTSNDNICNCIYQIPIVRQSDNICLFTQKPSSSLIDKFKDKQLILIIDQIKNSKKSKRKQSEQLMADNQRKQSVSSNGSLQSIPGLDQTVIGARQLKSLNLFDSIIILPRLTKAETKIDKFNSVTRYIQDITDQIHQVDVWRKLFIILPTQFDQLDEVLNIIWERALNSQETKKEVFKQKQKSTSLSFDLDRQQKMISFIKIEAVSNNDHPQYIIINFQRENVANNKELDSIVDLITDQVFFCPQINQITHLQKEELRDLIRQCQFNNALKAIEEIRECKINFNSLNQMAIQPRYLQILYQMKIDINVVLRIFKNHGIKIDDCQQFDHFPPQIMRQPSKSIDLDENDNSLLPLSFGHQIGQTMAYTFPVDEQIYEF